MKQEQSRREFVTRAIGVGAVAVSGGSLLAACGSDGETGSGVTKDTAAVKGGPKTTPNKDVIYPEGYVGPTASHKSRIVVKNEKVSLKVVVPQDQGVADWNTNEFTKWYEKRTGVHVEWQAIGSTENPEDTMTKVNAMIASGDIPDVFMGIELTESQVAIYGEKGLFIPLEKYIADYGVEIDALFKAYPVAKELVTTPDGHIYSMPYVNDCYHCNTWGNRLWVYKPWLDDLGLDMPETLDDFEAMLEAFVNRDPNGNGEADEVPLMGYKDELLDTFFMGSFLYDPGEPWLTLNNGKVEVAYNKDGWREGLRYMNRLYEKGLFAKEAFTQSMEQLMTYGDNQGEPILGAARTGTVMGFISIDDVSKDARWRQYVCVPTLRGPDGTQVAAWNYYDAVSVGRFVVTQNCQNPAVAVMWADGLYELEAQMRAYSGIPGKQWRWAKQGEIGIDGRQAIWASVPYEGKIEGKGWNQIGPNFRANDYRLGQSEDPDMPSFETPLYKESTPYYDLRQPIEQQLPPLYMTEAQAALKGELEVSLTNHVKTHMSRFVVGQLDIDDDKAWKEYTDTIDSIGLERYLQAHQEAYDAKYK